MIQIVVFMAVVMVWVIIAIIYLLFKVFEIEDELKRKK